MANACDNPKCQYHKIELIGLEPTFSVYGVVGEIQRFLYRKLSYPDKTQDLFFCEVCNEAIRLGRNIAVVGSR